MAFVTDDECASKKLPFTVLFTLLYHLWMYVWQLETKLSYYQLLSYRHNRATYIYPISSLVFVHSPLQNQLKYNYMPWALWLSRRHQASAAAALPFERTSHIKNTNNSYANRFLRHSHVQILLINLTKLHHATCLQYRCCLGFATCLQWLPWKFYRNCCQVVADEHV